jgi:DNA-binding transcriptional MocR family regulator
VARSSWLDAFPASGVRRGRTRYLDILAMVERGIATGRLVPGAPLPTQRALARHLRTAVGTVTRAYSEAERLGLVVGEVGRGTYVSAHRHTSATPGIKRGVVIDLTMNRPPNDPAAAAFAHALRALSKRRDVSDLLGDEPANGWLRHRLAAAKWIAQRGILADAENVIACNGVQHALSVVLGALSGSADVVATEDLNYPGVPLLAKLYRLNVVGIPMDHHGLRADLLDRVCQRQAVKLLVCSPTVHNPTTVTMSWARRQEIVDVAQKRGLIVIENDILGMLPAQRVPPLSSLAPDRCCYLTGLSKLVATGLRLGFVVAPPVMLDKVTTALHSTTWMPPPLMAELFTILVENGSIARIIEWHREEAAARGDHVREVLRAPGADVRSAGYCAWLKLPDEWPEAAFVEAGRSRNVLVAAGRAFDVCRQTAGPNAVRIGLGSVNSRERIERATETLAAILRSRRGRTRRSAYVPV